MEWVVLSASVVVVSVSRSLILTIGFSSSRSLILTASVVVVSVSRSLIFTGGVGCSIGLGCSISSCRICI